MNNIAMPACHRMCNLQSIKIICITVFSNVIRLNFSEIIIIKFTIESYAASQKSAISKFVYAALQLLESKVVTAGINSLKSNTMRAIRGMGRRSRVG